MPSTTTRAIPPGATTTRAKLCIALLACALPLAGCGRKNLPVAPTGQTPIGTEAEPGSPDAPQGGPGVASFQRASRLSNVGDLTVSPAEVSRNPAAKKKPFFLDPLLN